VILMGVEKLDSILKKLKKHGLSDETKIAVVEKGTLEDQKIIISDFKNIRKKMKNASIKPPAVIIIGEVVSLSERIRWI
jgi:siroheme synthase